MTKLTWLLTIVLLLISLGLRLFRFENRTPFDWDQNRDYGEVHKILDGQYVALGPVAKGSGGFYLGSFYYYLLASMSVITQAQVSTLPLTSLLLDSLVVVIIFLGFRRIIPERLSFLLALFWGTCWFFIESAHISWNVSLLPLWVTMTYLSLFNLLKEGRPIYLYSLAFLAGMAFHVHVTVLALIPTLILLFGRKLKFSLSIWFQATMIATLPLLPLIFYDLRHSFFNLHLVRDFLSYRTRVDTSYLAMLQMALTKLGKLSSGIFLAQFKDSIWLGILVSLVSLKSFFSSKVTLKISGATILLSLVQVILFRDYGFPEYYFGLTSLAMIVITITYLSSLHYSLPYLVVGWFILINLLSYTTTPTSFSLSHKRALIKNLEQLQTPLDIHYQFDPGRDGGLRYLVDQSELVIDKSSPTRILLTDKINTPLYIEGELARDLYQVGNLKSALYIVQ